MFFVAIASGAAAIFQAVSATAQTADTPAAASPAPICTDRPTRSNVTCAVPTGIAQIEGDATNRTRLPVDGGDTDTILYTNPTIEYGLGSGTDIEANNAPCEAVRTHGQGADETLHGVSDLYVGVKQRPTPADDTTRIALIPYVKAPAARPGIDDSRRKGGVGAWL